VSLRGMLSPSQHQAMLLRDAMSLLQVWRRFGSHSLSRSVRLDKLKADALETVGYSPTAADNARFRASIAKNAHYFKSHINFACKLGDIAEKLRFTKPEHRSEALVKELTEINASGKVLGGDPLNRCSDGQFQMTVHIPINEGHVFRSKERTPVLLLAELVSDPRGATTALSSASQVYVNGVNENHSILHDREAFLSSDDQPEQEDDNRQANLSEARGSTEEIIESNRSLLLDQAQSGENENEISCPESPLSHASPSLHYRALSHGLFNSSPRGSVDFGKEMMVDMIATLIDNQQYSIPSQPLDNNIDHIPAPPLQDIAIGIAEESNINTQITHDNVERESVEISQPRCDWSEKHNGVMLKRAELGDARKLSALGSVFLGNATPTSADVSQNKALHLTATGQFRRDVLFAIMDRGMRGNNVIGKGAATAARRAIQAIDRSRAISLMNGPDNVTNNGVVEQNATSVTSYDEDKLMEALRLLIIQNRAAKGVPSSSGHNGVDAGEVDKRLAGCGQISSSLLSSLRLWKGGIVSNRELLDLVQKDLLFLKHSVAFGFLDESKLIEDSAFWGRFSFGERWAEKKARLAALSPHGSSPEWDLIGCIVKSNDDLRQEAFVMQLIVLCDEAFRTAGLDLWIHPYNIVATGRSTGIIECVRDAMSFDSLKKRPGYGTDGLVGHFTRMAEIAADPLKALNESKLNFVRSLAAYSLMSYLFMFKDRHNGNLLLDTAGHVIHIDFGFVFGIAPGGSFSLEQSTPFKLTDEMLEVMGGLGSPLFSEFVTLFCCGFLALQVHADTFLTVVEVTCRGSSFNCFDGKDPEEIVMMLRERFCPDLNKSQTVAYALDLIKFATTSYGTKQYDYFQYLSQGIAT
jgi:phosphatidylinositol 4-kinase